MHAVLDEQQIGLLLLLVREDGVECFRVFDQDQNARHV